VAGSIEGFVTGSGLSTLLRVGVGVTVEVAFILYVVVQGRKAASLGETGLLGNPAPTWGEEHRIPPVDALLAPSGT
jgi:hypothetical protein